MINVSNNNWIPSNGYKYITNGKIYTDSIFLGRFDDILNWYDTNDEPQEEVPEEEITLEDKSEAYDILTGGIS